MFHASQTGRRRRFACTQCGACCNRSPEVGLSEAAVLSDLFVFRMMFRLYELPRKWSDGTTALSAEEFYETKRLLAAFAARKYVAKTKLGAKAVETVRYLTISALPLESASGSCAALHEGRCSIYDRRPLACRTVPFHYSRPEASAERDLDAFVGTPGYGCDTGLHAPVVLEAGRIVDPQARQARSDALDRARHDGDWEEAILRGLKSGGGDDGLPSLREIEANAPYGATTVSMGVAWRIAAEAGVIAAAECARLIASQKAVIERELAATTWGSEARETLVGMRAEYLDPRAG